MVKPALATWQESLRPVMVAVLAVLTGFFMLAAIGQFLLMQDLLDSGPAFDYPAFVDAGALPDRPPPADELEHAQWRQLALLEAYAIQQRYHQAKLFVVSRIWMRFLGFIVGMTLALLGAAFILGKLREARSELNLEGGGAKLALISASPGIILSALGAALMITAMLSSADINVADKSVYTQRWTTPLAALERASAGKREPPRDAGAASGSGTDVISIMRDRALQAAEKAKQKVVTEEVDRSANEAGGGGAQ